MEKPALLKNYTTYSPLNKDGSVSVIIKNDTREMFILRKISDSDRILYERLLQNPIPNTPRILDICEEESGLFVLEEYISGKTLEANLRIVRCVSESQAVQAGIELCRILQAYHQMDPAIVHGAITPRHIIVQDDGTFYLLDPAAKPEQYDFAPGDIRADICGLGKLMDTMLTGDAEVPYSSGDISQIIGHARDTESGYNNVTEFLENLESLSQTLPPVTPLSAKRKTNAEPDTAAKEYGYTLPGFRRKNPKYRALAVCGYIAMLVVSILYRSDTAVTFAAQIANKIICLGGLFAMVAISFDYRGAARFRIFRKRDSSLLNILLSDVVVLFMAFLIMAFAESLLNKIGF